MLTRQKLKRAIINNARSSISKRSEFYNTGFCFIHPNRKFIPLEFPTW